MSENEAVQALGALAHPLRLRIFRALVVVGLPGLTPGAIIAGVQVPAATLSFHLRELAAAGLVTQERSGRHLVYRAAFGRMNGLVDFLASNCCQGADCGVPVPAAARRCG